MGCADHRLVLDAGRILDRGRLAVGMLMVAPLGALLPSLVQPERERGAGEPQWGVQASSPNPIAAAPVDPQDIVANLTNPTVGGAAGNGAAPPASSSGPGTTSPPREGQAPAPATGPAGIAEVGSESDDTSAAAQSVDIPGTAPDAALADKLRRSQSRFAPTQPAATPSEGPMPFATPLTAVYPAPQGSSHVFPVVGGASYSNDWGSPRPGGRSHQGIDLFARAGTPIVAVNDGTLSKVGWNRVGGWRFWLRDEWGNEFYHAHLSAFAPAAVEGATVKKGTVIGFVGNTGDAKATPPHVHFEIHPAGGRPVPPFTYMNAWPRL
jgi:murein DD-endopeptidase MepM/ murein hydrolase activator NlpD